MREVIFPYGKEKIKVCFDNQLKGVLESSIHQYSTEYSEQEIIDRAIQNPIGCERLSELAKDKENIVIIASDHTRPVPSKLIIPALLNEIRSTNPKANITILIATGCHRETTKQELIDKFGEEIVLKERIVVHDCDTSEFVNLGKLPSNGDCKINSIAVNADLLIAEGFIEPHFFAGFSGGRKSVLPGIASRKSVLANHCSEFIAHKNARTGILEKNPIHEDMLWAAKQAKLKYIVNVVLNSEKEVIYACAGDCEKAHQAGVEFLSSLCGVEAIESDIVITTNGGYPLDQNVYQAVKSMTAAEACVKENGVIIVLAKSNDGIGGEHFYHQLADEKDIYKTMDLFLQRNRLETVPDQWQTQIFLRILMKATVIYISDVEDELIENMHMIPAHSIDEALEKAKNILNKKDASILAIPDGVSVIVKNN